MIIINDKKISLLVKLIISYLLLLNFAFLFYVFNTDPGSDQTAKGAVLTNLLVWTATLFTPIAAYFFYDSWKEEKRYEITKELMIDISTILSDLYMKIEKSAILASYLKETKDHKIILNNLINVEELRNTNDLNKIYALINLYKSITNDKKLMEYKSNFDKTTFELVLFLTKLDPLYLQYIESLDLKIESIYIKTKTYKEGEKEKVKEQIFKINYYLNNPLPFGKEIKDYNLTFDTSRENFKKSYEKFIEEISKRLNP